MDSAKIRAEILARAVLSLGALDGVEAICLSGSLAEKTEDQYSDIDLRVVVADRAYESVRRMREHLPTTWGSYGNPGGIAASRSSMRSIAAHIDAER